MKQLVQSKLFREFVFQIKVANNIYIYICIDNYTERGQQDRDEGIDNLDPSGL